MLKTLFYGKCHNRNQFIVLDFVPKHIAQIQTDLLPKSERTVRPVFYRCYGIIRTRAKRMIGFDKQRRSHTFVCHIRDFEFVLIDERRKQTFLILDVGVFGNIHFRLNRHAKIAEFLFVTDKCRKRMNGEISLYAIFVGKFITCPDEQRLGNGISSLHFGRRLFQQGTMLLKSGLNTNVKRQSL